MPSARPGLKKNLPNQKVAFDIHSSFWIIGAFAFKIEQKRSLIEELTCYFSIYRLIKTYVRYHITTIIRRVYFDPLTLINHSVRMTL